MTNREWLNSLSDEELAEKVFPNNGCVFCAYNDGNCHQKDCTKGQVDWLKQKRTEHMPELQVGDIIVVLLDKGLINKIVVCLIVMSDKHASNINGVMYNLEDLNIRKIKRMNNTNERVEIIWRADDDKT